MTATLKVNVVRKPTINVKVLPRFPVSLSAVSPILLNSVGGAYSFSLSIPALRTSLDSVYAPIGGGAGTPGGSNTQLQYNNAGAFGGLTVGGDATLNTGTGALTFSTVNSNVGTFGGVTTVPIITLNAKGLATAASTSIIREVLTASRTYFVRSDGSDSNTGLVNSAGGAFLTWAKAVAIIANALDFAGNTVTVTNGNGASYATGINLNVGFIAGGIVIFDLGGGAITSGTAFNIGNGVTLPGPVTIQNGTLSGANGIAHAGVGQLILGSGMTFGACSGRHVQATSPGAYISFGFASYSISGGASNHLFAADQGRIDALATAVTLTGNIVISDATNGFAFAERMGQIITGTPVTNYVTLGGHTVTGRRYNSTLGGVIDTATAGANTTYFPGTVAGTGTNSGTTPFGLYN
jgi:hypothetical protein